MSLLASSRRAARRSRVLVPSVFAALLLRALAPHGAVLAASAGGVAPYCAGGVLRAAVPGTPRGERASFEHAVCGHGAGPCPADAGRLPVASGRIDAPAAARLERHRAAATFPWTLPPARAPPRREGAARGLQAAA